MRYVADTEKADDPINESHAAIYLGQTLAGITVIDQWNGHTKQPPHRRTIHFRRGKGSPVNDGSQYYVVE
ncbi:hypothetical protein OKW43_001273 [Paraburkholderia sp. WC7.3g]|uniref:BPSL0067 family protein n=1 Tax=Paraburkholderia podalyriae TaxID=1938811 RepID=A0ABR7PPV7_9BURK|nr:BPSL0067 family protein [Paraburkholderia podalyriae]MBC8748320.1 BPSL0067 family protein [Paraburkholderia podalyriae]